MLRITSGIFRGRIIQTPSHLNVRPTQAKLRQALFNSLQTRIVGAKVLDLFAGSGALGFEALSCGAEHVTFVEKVRPHAKCIEKNAKLLQVQDRVQILNLSVEVALDQLKRNEPFDLIFVDPPYAEGWELRLLTGGPWEGLLASDGCLCLEWGRQKSVVTELPDQLPFLVKIREKIYGESILTTYLKKVKVD